MNTCWCAILALAFAGSTASAQSNGFDLETMPAGYSFESAGMTGNTTMTYLRNDNGVYIFESSYKPLSGAAQVSVSRINRQSQTLSRESTWSVSVYAPHDCGPSLGICINSMIRDGELFQLRTETVMVDDIWIKEKYVMQNGEWVHYFRSCSTYDAYGFWVDSVSYRDGVEDDWDYRKTPAMPNHPDARLARLRRACAPVDYTS